MTFLRRPLAHPGLIDLRAVDAVATIHPPEEIAHRVHAIDEIAEHGVLLLEHLVLLDQADSLHGEVQLVLIGHG